MILRSILPSLLSFSALSASTLLPQAELKPFLDTHCIECHGPDKEKGDVRLDTISWSLEDRDSAELWGYVLEVVEEGEMPPKKKPRPAPQDLKAFIEILDAQLESASPLPTPSPPAAKLEQKKRNVESIDFSSTGIPLIIERFGLSHYIKAVVGGLSKKDQNMEAPSYEEVQEDFHELSTAQPTDIDRITMQPFLEQHCIECHGADKQKGQVRFDNVSYTITNNDEAQRWQDVLDVLNGGEMPPEEEPRPDHELLLSTLNSLTKTLVTARKRLTDHGGVITMRRLNRREYVNTVRELFGFNISEHILPEDAESESFDTIGEEQFFGSVHFERYLNLGTQIAQEGFNWSNKPLAKPKATRKQPEGVTKNLQKKVNEMEAKMAQIKAGKTWKQLGFKDAGAMKIFTNQYKGKHASPSRYVSAPLTDKGQYLFTNLRETDTISVPVGRDPRAAYRIKIHGGVVEGSPAIRQFVSLSGGEGTEAVLHMKGTPNAPQTVEMLNSPSLFGGSGNLTIAENASVPTNNLGRGFSTYLNKIGSENTFASIWIDWIEVEGPFYPRKSNFFGNLIDPKSKGLGKPNQARELIHQFAYEAFRRQEPEAEYIDKLVAYYEQLSSSGKSYQQAMSETLGVVLASPKFLYIEESLPDTNSRTIDARQFAVRLAYFLWSSPPDEELYNAARYGNISEPSELKKQIRRMLNDPKADAFYEGFMSQWAELDRFEAISVDLKEYYRFNQGVRHSAQEEVIEFFKILVKEDLAVHNLIDSDFVVVNSHLASHYGIDGVNSNEFQKVSIPANSTRGGLITQTAFLTIGSNGERSSPVIRGTMVLDKILNDPPPPPPPNVPELGSDTKIALTNREMVQAHQKQTVCASCHSRIDPIGFGMENYDAIGQWRQTEKVGDEERRIQEGGKLISGIQYRDINDLKRLLKTQKHKLAREMIESMLSYGLGRTIEFSDTEQIDQLVERCQYDDYSLQNMIYRVVSSPLFTTK